MKETIDKRPEVINLVKKEIYGPLDQNSQEVVTDDPLARYFCGVLYPQNIKDPIEEGDEGTTKDDADSTDDEDNVPYNKPKGENVFKDLTEEEEKYLNLSNAYKQSALSLSIAVPLAAKLSIKVSFAKYIQAKSERKWQRVPEEKTELLDGNDLKGITNSSWKQTLFEQGENKLSLNGFYRWRDGNVYVFTFSVVNETKFKAGDQRYAKAADCFFQVQLSIFSEEGLLPIPNKELFKNPSEDAASNSLLYRKSIKYSVGHGCSPIWDDRASVIKEVHSDFLPTYELKTVIPVSSGLGMKDIYTDATGTKTFHDLQQLCDSYEAWINKQYETIESDDFEKRYLKAANMNLANCKECLKRIQNGIDVLKQNQDAFLAFKLMNKAMLLQQIHSKLDKREIIKDENKNPKVQDGVIPILDDESTWKKGPVYGKWRAFQIAFILLSIPSIVDHTGSDHGDVDLIWFPTGGGKTEAYLGLSAFAILYKRIKKKDDGDCVQIFMRYTLRLLTSQQYERAAALICSLEHLRREDPALLGGKPITIGLWVGGKTTPNTVKGAIETYDRINSNHSGKYPFAITKCPWCGAEIGPAHGRIFGIKKDNIKEGRRIKRVIFFSCPDEHCEFHSKHDPSSGLPLSVIDEKIYENPPTLLVGTVDKFAILPYKPKAKTLFGLRNGPKAGRNHPELIIQDELHLISGPLGSTVAAYETMMNFLCSYEENGTMVKPKIIASTATISQAKRQCHELFDVPEEKVKIFPPSAIDNGETFFSMISNNDLGREYVGIFAPGAQSSATSAIHILAALYEGKRFIDYEGNDDLKDAYWTNVCYYNSIRELAQAVNWVDADIYEHAKIILGREENPDFKTTKLYRPNYMELNSRNQDLDIGTGFDMLSLQISDSGGKKQVLDFCFSTNMISVGIDIDRLGLMTVFGQPKTTSEYIQATSRVGRSAKRPGLVFAFYNAGKPRDKSIFESFEDFHSKFYSYVEPTSISPFCSELRSRVIPAILVGIARYISPDDSENGAGLKKAYGDGYLDKAEEAILDRVKDIDPAEFDDTKKQIDSVIGAWEKQNIDQYNYPLVQGQDLSKRGGDPTPAICPDGEYPFIPEGWKKGTMPAPTSMRSVDLGCQFMINDDYVDFGGGRDGTN